MEQFDDVRQSISIVREMHRRWIAAIAIDRHWDLMELGDGSGYGDRGYFSAAVNVSADISRSGLYLMLFAQFEAEVNRRCEALIKRHKANPDWHERRAWETFNEKNVSSIYFLRRLSLLINKGRPIYAAMQTLYLERNDLAHGTKTILEIEMAEAIETIEAAVAAMEENP